MMIILRERREIYESLLPKRGIGAELGAYDGENAELMLYYTQSTKLYLCDTWNWSIPHVRPAQDAKYAANHRASRFPQMEVIHQASQDWLKTLPDKSLDWVYLDTTGTYGQTSLELQLLRSKVKRIIAGHDLCCTFCHRNQADEKGGGVMLALMEEIGKGWLELIAVTLPHRNAHYHDVYPSWVCRITERI